MPFPFDVPVVPDAPEARDLLTEELSKPEYAAAQPTLFDIISEAFFEWLQRVFTPGAAVGADWLLVAVVGLVIAGIIVAIVIWGVPRINRRSSVADVLFGDDDRRSASELRASAQKAAERGDFNTAVIEQYRAVARGLAERTVVMVSPGTTAHDFASRAAQSFPDQAEDLATAADEFDGARYLGRTATEAHYRHVRALDDGLAHRAPVSHEPVTSGAPS
ncbi:DUF4129 domain-containing protein [Okibacterium endophyticum]